MLHWIHWIKNLIQTCRLFQQTIQPEQLVKTILLERHDTGHFLAQNRKLRNFYHRSIKLRNDLFQKGNVITTRKRKVHFMRILRMPLFQSLSLSLSTQGMRRKIFAGIMIHTLCKLQKRPYNDSDSFAVRKKNNKFLKVYIYSVHEVDNLLLFSDAYLYKHKGDNWFPQLWSPSHLSEWQWSFLEQIKQLPHYCCHSKALKAHPMLN